MVAEEYHTRDELIAEFLALERQHPQFMSHEIVGQTTEGRDIYLFKIGNSNGGRVMFSATHGDELCGPEIYLLYAKWLLENREPGVSDRILKRNLTLIIPHINLDRYKSTRTNQGTRKNANGVDLNRNFPATWRTDCIKLGDCINSACLEGQECIDGWCYKNGCSCYWSDLPTKYNYRGESPASEVETQVMVSVFKSWLPKFFLDYHQWEGPYFAKTSWRGRKKAEQNGWGTYDQITARHDEVGQKIRGLASERGVTVYPYYTLGACGLHADEACATGGATSYLIEGHNYRVNGTMQQCPYEEIETKLFPSFLPFAIVFSQECEVIPPPPQPSLLPLIVFGGLMCFLILAKKR